MARHEHWYKNGMVHTWKDDRPVNDLDEWLVRRFVHGCLEWEKKYKHLHGMSDVLFDRYTVTDGTRTFTYPPAI